MTQGLLTRMCKIKGEKISVHQEMLILYFYGLTYLLFWKEQSGFSLEKLIMLYIHWIAVNCIVKTIILRVKQSWHYLGGRTWIHEAPKYCFSSECALSSSSAVLCSPTTDNLGKSCDTHSLLRRRATDPCGLQNDSGTRLHPLFLSLFLCWVKTKIHIKPTKMMLQVANKK